MEPFEHTAHELHALLRTGEISSLEITGSIFRRIEEIEPDVNAYITLTKSLALKQAEEADKMIKRGDIRPFTGIPLGVKDLICLKGAPTTCGSRILNGYIPPYDATVIEKLRKQGAVFIGKTNMDEFAMGSSNETSYFGTTKNPWNLNHVPGGSSGGSAAATAARECIASLGSDTGGSIRQPASHCGIVGLKPTYGRVSRYGLIAFASSLDQIGPMTLDIRDCALLLGAISGHDPLDATSVPVDVPDYADALGMDLEAIRVGIPTEYFGKGIDKDVKNSVRKAVNDLETMGAHMVEINLPHTEYAVSVYYIIAPAEASSNLARYDGIRYGFRADERDDLLEMYLKTRTEGFGPEVVRRIMLGTYALSVGYYEDYYEKASRVRSLIVDDFMRAFQRCDIILTPVTPTPAFRLGEKIDDPLTMYLTDMFTISANLAGIPAIALPYGISRKGLPIGIQIMGKYFDEQNILKVAFALEQEMHPWKGRLPLQE